jgi:GDP-L-fucose synthase
MDLSNKTTVVTGSHGFLGRRVCAALARRHLHLTDLGPHTKTQPGTVYGIRSVAYDLTYKQAVASLFLEAKPNLVIHLAAVVGGIGINRQKPGTFCYKNLMMGALLLEQARQHNLEKLIIIGTVCSYPKHTTIPFKEENLWDGYPEETNAPYGIAKKVLLVQAQAYRQEFGLNTIYLIPVNLYGPGDNFNPESSHVIPALIKKCIEARDAGQATITCWGSGQATREFLYVDDAAEAIVLAAEKYDGAEPINIGNGQEVPINYLVETIARLTHFTGKIIWDSTYPDGQPRRCLDVSKAERFCGFRATIGLEEGLTRTIAWYERTKNDCHDPGPHR